MSLDVTLVNDQISEADSLGAIQENDGAISGGDNFLAAVFDRVGRCQKFCPSGVPGSSL